PAHRVVYVPGTGGWIDITAQDGEDVFHSNFADGGPLPLVALGVVLAAAVLLREKRSWGGIVVGVLAVLAAFVAFASVFLAHFMSKYETSSGELVFALGVIALGASGAIQFIETTIDYVTTRRRARRQRLLGR